MFAEAVKEGVDVLGCAFDDQFDVAVVKVFDGAGEGQVASEVNGGCPEADALDAAGKPNSTSLTHRACPSERGGSIGGARVEGLGQRLQVQDPGRGGFRVRS